MPAPVIILSRPQLGENIGAVARAMSNFGLSELRIAAPRDGWPNQKALDMASGGAAIIEAATLFPDFASALHDIHIAYATTARPRDMEKRAVTPAEAMEEISGPTHSAQKIALVFGPERTGLENDEIALCDTIITIPTAPENSSLNIAQSAVVLGYEWFKQVSGEKSTLPETQNLEPESLATKGEMLGLFSQLEQYLDESNYYRIEHKKPIMWQNMQTMLLRGRWSSQEVQSFRGMLRVLWEGRRPRSRPK